MTFLVNNLVFHKKNLIPKCVLFLWFVVFFKGYHRKYSHAVRGRFIRKISRDQDWVTQGNIQGPGLNYSVNALDSSFLSLSAASLLFFKLDFFLLPLNHFSLSRAVFSFQEKLEQFELNHPRSWIFSYTFTNGT